MAAGLQRSSVSPARAQHRQAGCDYSPPADAVRIGGPLALRDGRQVRARAIRPDDGKRLCALYARLTPETIYLRYCGARAALSEEEARHLACVDYERRMAVVAAAGAEEGDTEERIVAVVEYAAVAPSVAEVAFLVEDAWQGLGIGTQLLYALGAYARRHGFVTLIAMVLPRNVRMLGVLRHCGFPYAEYEDQSSACVEVHLDITAPPVAW